MPRPKSPKNIPTKLPPFEADTVLIKSGKNTDWSHDYYNITKVHEQGFRGAGVKVAVLDTGLDLTHNSFKKAISEERLFALDARVGKDDPTDKNGHGTFCVSRYISDGQDALGFAPDSTVYSIKVLNDNGSGSLDAIIRGVEMALDLDVDIISSSLGWPNYVRSFDPVVAKVLKSNTLWLSAAGNDGTVEDIDYPALYPSVISVGSINEHGKRANHSDFGVDLDLYSSGENVKAAWLNNQEAVLKGTSMATPSLGGIIALLLKEKLTFTDGTTHREVLKKIAKCQ